MSVLIEMELLEMKAVSLGPRGTLKSTCANSHEHKYAKGTDVH